MTEHHPLDCMKCPAMCCRMAGYVTVTPDDISRLAAYLKLSVPVFEERHIVHVTRAGRKRIKAGYETCQFLGEDRRCTVYAARPSDCGGYYCWDQPDDTVYEFARFAQTQVVALRLEEALEKAPKRRRKE